MRIPSPESEIYITHSFEVTTAPYDKEDRDRRKNNLMARAEDVLEKYGKKIPYEAHFRYGSGEQMYSIPTLRRVTPIAHFQLEGGRLIGLRLAEDIIGISPTQAVIDKIHLTLHDPVTGKQIGARSAMVFGVYDDFVSAVEKNGQIPMRLIKEWQFLLRWSVLLLICKMQHKGQSQHLKTHQLEHAPANFHP